MKLPDFHFDLQSQTCLTTNSFMRFVQQDWQTQKVWSHVVFSQQKTWNLIFKQKNFTYMIIFKFEFMICHDARIEKTDTVDLLRCTDGNSDTVQMLKLSIKKYNLCDQTGVIV